jgi:hypothetical protein
LVVADGVLRTWLALEPKGSDNATLPYWPTFGRTGYIGVERWRAKAAKAFLMRSNGVDILLI